MHDLQDARVRVRVISFGEISLPWEPRHKMHISKHATFAPSQPGHNTAGDYNAMTLLG